MVDDLDRDIIRALQQDGRRSNVEIARALGVAESTVRKRIDRLLHSSTVRIVGLPSLSALGLSVQVQIYLQVEPAYADEIANQMAGLPQVQSVTYTTGEYSLVVQAAFPDNDALRQFLSVEVAALSGVIRTTTAHILQHVKAPHQWRLPKPAPPRVLIVDDDPDFCEVSRIVLEDAGYEVLAAPDGDTGLEVMRTHYPDAIIMDVMMNSLLEGISTTWTIRADTDLRTTPILMVSSIADSQFAEAFPTDEYLPVDNFLCKPIAPQELLQTINRLIKSNRTSRADLRAQRRPR
jgi:DNA-binding Lrp family transcriptional regulator/CheY-like chemotaxis protein